MSDDNFSLALTTAVKPPKKFTVDEVEYEMLGVDHLSPSDEAEVLAVFSRHAILTRELDAERNVVKGKVIAERARKSRLAVIKKLTTLGEVAERLPLTQQVLLLEAIHKEVVPEDADREDEDEDRDDAGEETSESVEVTEPGEDD